MGPGKVFSYSIVPNISVSYIRGLLFIKQMNTYNWSLSHILINADLPGCLGGGVSGWEVWKYHVIVQPPAEPWDEQVTVSDWSGMIILYHYIAS